MDESKARLILKIIEEPDFPRNKSFSVDNHFVERDTYFARINSDATYTTLAKWFQYAGAYITSYSNYDGQHHVNFKLWSEVSHDL